MDFSIRQDIDAPLSTVEALLCDPSFVTATSALDPLADCRLLGVESSGDRVEARIHRRFAARLPAVVTAVVDPRRLTWVEEVTFDRVAHTGDHRIVPDHYADLLRCTFTSALWSDGSSTHRHVEGVMRVRVLLGGRQVERAIVSGLRDYAAAEAVLLAEWAARRPADPT